MWSEHYRNLVNRNIGLLTEEQQNKLKSSCVAVCGLGGLGGVISEILARTGIEAFRILDHGTFEPTNLNRQVYCYENTNGRRKTDVTEEFIKKINPDARIEKCETISEENVHSFLQGVDAVALSIDSTIPVIIISRAAQRLKIPLVEGWAVAYGNVRVFTDQTLSLEEAYNFPTVGRAVSSISREEEKKLMFQSLSTLQAVEGLRDFYPEPTVKRLLDKGEGTTLAPMVWMTACMMAMEVFKILLNLGKLALAPAFFIYDPITHQIRS